MMYALFCCVQILYIVLSTTALYNICNLLHALLPYIIFTTYCIPVCSSCCCCLSVVVVVVVIVDIDVVAVAALFVPVLSFFISVQASVFLIIQFRFWLYLEWFYLICYCCSVFSFLLPFWCDFFLCCCCFVFFQLQFKLFIILLRVLLLFWFLQFRGPSFLWFVEFFDLLCDDLFFSLR